MSRHKKKPNKYWMFGKHAVLAAIDNPDREVGQVLVTQNTQNELGVKGAQIVDTKQIEKLLGDNAVHQGIAAEVTPLKESGIEDISDSKVVVILDQVTDPHNIGAILRSCSAFGAGGIIVQDKNAPSEGGVMAKAASGALETVPIVEVVNLSKTMEELKDDNFWCVGMDGTARDHINKLHNYDKIALVMGAEGRGLRDLVMKNCDLLAKVPINDSIESLNVSNAAAVALYELSKN